MKKNGTIVCICNCVAMICFALVSYGQFYHGKTGMGVMFALLTVSQAVLAALNFRRIAR